MTSEFHYTLPALAGEVAAEEGLLSIARSYRSAAGRDALEWLGTRRSRGWRESKYRGMK